MDTGIFFCLDDKSVPHDGIILFRYLRLRLKSSIARFSGSNRLKLPEYPIYMSLEPDSIRIYYNGVVLNDQHNNTESELHTVNAEILHLPLSQNLSLKDNLTSILLQISNTQKGAYEYNEDYYKYYVDSKGYNGLKCFLDNDNLQAKPSILFRNLLLDFIYDLEHGQVFENSPHYEEVELRLRQNLLFRSISTKWVYCFSRREFQNSAISKGNALTLDCTGKNIIAKQVWKNEGEWLEILQSTEFMLLLRSQSGQWFKSIEKEFREILSKSPNEEGNHKHFNRAAMVKVLECLDREQERNRADTDKGIDDSIKTENFGRLKSISTWFLKRYAVKEAFNTLMQPLQLQERIMIQGCWWGILGILGLLVISLHLKLLIGVYVLFCLGITMRGFDWKWYSLVSQKNRIMDWIEGLLKCILLMSLIVLGLVNFFSYQYTFHFFGISIFILLLYCCLHPKLACRIVSGKWQLCISPGTIANFRKLPLFLMALIGIVAFTISILMLCCYSSWLGFLGGWCGINFLALMIILRRRILAKFFSLLLPRLVMAITSGWLFIILTDEAWRIGFQIPIWTGWLFILLVFIYLLLFLELKNFAPDIGVRLYRRVFSVLSYGLSVSLIIGVLLMNIFAPETLLHTGIIEKIWDEAQAKDVVSSFLFNVESGSRGILASFLPEKKANHRQNCFDVSQKKNPDCLQYVILKNSWPGRHKLLYIISLQPLGNLYLFPDMLFLRAVMALFIGVFFQLIFEEKQVTESN